MTARTQVPPIDQLIAKLKSGDVSDLSPAILGGRYLAEVSSYAKNGSLVKETLDALFVGLLREHSPYFDWNCGTLLANMPADAVIAKLSALSAEQRKLLHTCTGLAWCLGKFARRDPAVTDFLEDVVTYSQNPQSWWSAAWALQNLGIVNAVSYLKTSLQQQGVPTLDECLGDLPNERHRIGLLLHSKLNDLQDKILPQCKKVLCGRTAKSLEKVGAAWILARFHHLDEEIELALRHLLNSGDYQTRYRILVALREIRSPHFLEDFKRLLENELDPFLRRIAAYALGRIDDPRSLGVLYERLLGEPESEVLSAITRSIYDLTHHSHREIARIRRSIGANENGMIADDADKWYVNPDIYHLFSEAQDPENLCFRVAFEKLQHPRTGIQNPIDLGSGTGKLGWYILRNLHFHGTLHCVDRSEEMTEYLKLRQKRESVPTHLLSTHNSSILGLPAAVGKEVSSLIVASFAFPSKTTDGAQSIAELRAVHDCLMPGGMFVMVGWDETFNDRLSEMWYRFVPDNRTARSFEEWRLKRIDEMGNSARNSSLTWLKRGLRVPLEFVSIETSARVMGYLFGRSAAEEILYSRRTSWSMSLGITLDSREDIERILKNHTS